LSKSALHEPPPHPALPMNLPKDLGRTKMRKSRRKPLCPSQIFGAFFRRFSGSMREVLHLGNLSAGYAFSVPGGISGARPSPGAAGWCARCVLEFSVDLVRAEVAAPGDGRALLNTLLPRWGEGGVSRGEGDSVHGPNVRPILEVEAFYEPELGASASLPALSRCWSGNSPARMPALRVWPRCAIGESSELSMNYRFPF
jgi:hypothetical protein